MYDLIEIEKEIEKINLSESIPENEPFRQYYFIKKIKETVDKLYKILDRELTACVVTFGCQMNARDSEKISGILKSAGVIMTDSEEADIVVYNTCTVRENANSRVYGRLGFLGKLKSRNPQMIIAMCGCMMQEEHVVETIKKSYRFVDIIFGTHNIYKLAELLYEYFEENGLIDINFN